MKKRLILTGCLFMPALLTAPPVLQAQTHSVAFKENIYNAGLLKPPDSVLFDQKLLS